MNNLRQKFLFLFLFIFFVFGSIISLKVGISHDEYHEEENWKYNLNLSKNNQSSCLRVLDHPPCESTVSPVFCKISCL